MNLIVKKVSDKTKEKAKQAVKPVFEEIGEQVKKIPLDVAQQIVGGKSNQQPSPIVEAMKQQSDDGELTEEEKRAKVKKHIRDTEELEHQIKKEKQQREEREKHAAELHDPQETEETVVRPGEPIMPPSKPSKGKAFAVQKKQKKIESRLGKN